MRRVSIPNLRSGDRVSRAVYTRYDAPPLLRAGAHISDGFRQSLERAGVNSVWIDDDLSAGIEPLEALQDENRDDAIAVIRKAFGEVSSAPGGGKLTPKVLDEVREVAERLSGDIRANADRALALNDFANADGYTMKHTLAATALGLGLGLRLFQKYGWLDYRGQRNFGSIDERLSILGVGLLLLDIGKLAVSPELLYKPERLTDDEWQLLRAHPEVGCQLLKDAGGVSPISRAVVRSHHERWDGTGYPEGKRGADIHQFARIAAVADVFDALTSDRPYRAAEAPHFGYSYILSRVGHDFDPEVVDIFRTSVAPHPPGTGVVLSDGSCAVVKHVQPGMVNRPVVRVVLDSSGAKVGPQDVNLAAHPEMTIVSADFDPWARPEPVPLA